MSPRILNLVLFAAFLCSLHSVFADDEGEVKLLKSDSRAPYVHRINLYDRDGRVIDPTDEFAGPYSVAMTCGKCHPYGQISGGWHFNAWNTAIAPGRPGEPWFLIDDAAETVLPISGRGWPGTFKPADAGLDGWDFIKRFGHHLPGGGYGAPSPDEIKKSAHAARWGVSGTLEVDCLICHAADVRHDPAEAERQIASENFQWLPTVAYGLAAIRGEARKAPDDWDPMMPPNPDHPEQAGPKLIWDLTRFDPDGRVVFDLVRRPPAERCYFCHSFREVGADEDADLLETRDVHLAAGLTCANCHRNELDHEIIRGYATEAGERKESELAAFTCQGCHLGAGGAEEAAATLGGYYGAPRPEHKGFPPLHFEELACTTCHSGPWPSMNAKRFQTALAHGLGLASREREDDDAPQIVAPVFAPQHDGKIAPQRMVWPSYWGVFEGERVVILHPDAVKQALKRAQLDRKKEEKTSHDPPLTDEQIQQILALLAEKHPDAALFRVREGVTLVRAPDSRVERHAYVPPADDEDEEDAEERKVAEPVDPYAALAAPYRWSFAHDVRPASQALGARGCTDCHSDDAPMYFGKVAAQDDPRAADRPVKAMYELRGADPKFASLWNLGFVYRPAFKWFGFACAGVISLVLLHYLLQGLGALSRRFGR